MRYVVEQLRYILLVLLLSIRNAYSVPFSNCNCDLFAEFGTELRLILQFLSEFDQHILDLLKLSCATTGSRAQGRLNLK